MGAGEPGTRGTEDEDRAGREWHRRPVLSFTLRLAVFAGPIAASVAIAALLSNVLPKAVNPLTAALWISVVVVGSLITLVIFERAARRLLPLAALLDVSLLFPDQAPKRFAVARQTGSPRDLQARLIEAHESGRLEEARTMQSVIELVLALSVHDKGTRGHSERVRVFTDLLADELKIDAHGRARLRWAALLHDVGKLEVPATILNKNGKPDEDEWNALHRHPEEGARLVAPLLPWLGEYGSAVVQHHERYDGTGYPLGLKGDEISLAARIVSVADTYEVMTAPRPYKRPMSVAASRRELTLVAGTQLDPTIVRAFLNISVGRLWRTIGIGAWMGQIPAVSRLLTGFGRAGTMAGSGVATAAAATLLTVGTVGGFGLLPHGHITGAGSTPSQTTGSPPGGRTTGPATGPVGPSQAPGSSTGSTPNPSGTTATPDPGNGGPRQTAGPTPSGSHPTPTPTGGATPTSNPTPPPPPPTPTPTPTPSPVSTCTPGSSPDPCSNTSPSCTSYCLGDHLALCTQYCEGDHNKYCTSYCYGDHNSGCLSYCYGKSNNNCTSNCNLKAMLAVLVVTDRAPTSWIRALTCPRTESNYRHQVL